MTEINIMSHGVDAPQFDLGRLTTWVEAVAAAHGRRVGRLSYLFCDDEYILATNRQFLQHDYYTDVITLDYSCHPMIAGDIFISLDTVASNAETAGIRFEDELHRILIHGVLHLTGQGDKTPETRAEMTRKENLALQMLT